MITFTLLNLANGVKFTKEFDSPYQARTFRLKCKYSKKVKIVLEQYPSENIREAVVYGW